MYREREISALMEYEEARLIPPYIRGQRFEARIAEKPRENSYHRRDFRISLKELLKPGVFEELCRIIQ